MSEDFEPKIVAFVCNWCTYLAADLAGTNRLEYPPNVRILRLPCTGRVDFNLIIKALEMGADAVVVSGCHPATAITRRESYRRAAEVDSMFASFLKQLGVETDRIFFSWISAAESKKWQQMITEITDQIREMGPYQAYHEISEATA